MHLGIQKNKFHWSFDANAASCGGANLLHQTDQLSWNKVQLQQIHNKKTLASAQNGTMEWNGWTNGTMSFKFLLELPRESESFIGNNLLGKCADGKVEEVKEALEAGADPNTRGGPEMMTCLMVATWKSQEKVVDLLLAQPGIQVNAKASNNFTALHFASKANSAFVEHDGISILKKLVAFPGIELNERNDEGLTPIMLAIISAGWGCGICRIRDTPSWWQRCAIEQSLRVVCLLAAEATVDLEVQDRMGRGLNELAKELVERSFCLDINCACHS